MEERKEEVTEEVGNLLKVIGDLECKSHTVRSKALNYLRTNGFKTLSDKQIRDSKLFKNLANLLKGPNPRILTYTLSILANSCLNPDHRLMVAESGAIQPLVNILKYIKQDDIQNRACRCVANLSMNRTVAGQLHQFNISDFIAKVLKTSKSGCTQQSAIRALRILWEAASDATTQNRMLRFNVVRIITERLITENHDVKQSALKALAKFTDDTCSKNCIANVVDQLNLDGNGYTVLLGLVPEKFANIVVFNLCCGPGIKFLNDNFAVEMYIGILARKEHQKQKILVYTLCMLCTESSGGPQLLYTENGVTVFLELLKQAENTMKVNLFRTLMRYTKEPMALLRFTKAGLIPFLMEELDAYVTAHGGEHQCKENPDVISIPKCPLTMSPVREQIRCLSSIHMNSDPDRSGASTSPASAVLGSPATTDSPVGMYSPVYDTTDDELIAMCMEDQDIPENDSHYFRFSDDHMNRNKLQKYITMQENIRDKGERRDSYITSILLPLAYIKDIRIQDISSNGTISSLISYIRETNFKGCFYTVLDFLDALTSNKEYYCELLDNQLILKIHRAFCRPNNVKCIYCNFLDDVGQSLLSKASSLYGAGLGEGQMAYRLLNGSDDVKVQIACTFPHVANDPKLLIKLFYKHKGMEILLKQMLHKDTNPEVLDDIMYVFRGLFYSLFAKNPPPLYPPGKCAGCDIGKRPTKESTVYFRLDDGSVVGANKATLVSSSPMFEAMFNGGFIESEQSEIKLCEVSKETFSYIIRLADSYCECLLPKSEINLLLELIVVSDRFLMSEIMKKILRFTMEFVLDVENCELVYRWAKESRLMTAKDTCVGVIKYILETELSYHNFRKAFVSMLNGKYPKLFTVQMSRMVKRALYSQSKKPNRLLH